MYIFAVGYTTGLLLYLLIQFDLDYKKRNKHDWHYTTWLIALPAVIGVSQQFHPKQFILRLFHGYMLFMLMLAWQRIFYHGVRFLKYPNQFHQKSTTTEIIEYEFRLAGSVEVFEMISFDERVIFFYFKFFIETLLNNKHFSISILFFFFSTKNHKLIHFLFAQVLTIVWIT